VPRWPGNARRQPTTFGGLTRSRLMQRVRSTGNETTEQRMARLLRKARLRGWRRHLRVLGKPDFAWPREKVALFIDGCFWHGHQCGRNLVPRTNAVAWEEKIRSNRKRDRRVSRQLRGSGWRVVRVWECCLGSAPMACVERVRAVLSPGCTARTRAEEYRGHGPR
jgi:DNA mismatch endonuclease (patch repair protein)